MRDARNSAAQRKMDPIISALTDFGPPKPVVFATLGEESEVAPSIIVRLRGLVCRSSAP